MHGNDINTWVQYEHFNVSFFLSSYDFLYITIVLTSSNWYVGQTIITHVLVVVVSNWHVGQTIITHILLTVVSDWHVGQRSSTHQFKTSVIVWMVYKEKKQVRPSWSISDCFHDGPSMFVIRRVRFCGPSSSYWSVTFFVTNLWNCHLTDLLHFSWQIAVHPRLTDLSHFSWQTCVTVILLICDIFLWQNFQICLWRFLVVFFRFGLLALYSRSSEAGLQCLRQRQVDLLRWLHNILSGLVDSSGVPAPFFKQLGDVRRRRRSAGYRRCNQGHRLGTGDVVKGRSRVTCCGSGKVGAHVALWPTWQLCKKSEGKSTTMDKAFQNNLHVTGRPWLDLLGWR